MGKRSEIDPRTNELVFEFRYPPNPRILDQRGEWAAQLSERLELTEWMVDANSVRLFNKTESRSLLVSFRNTALIVSDVETRNFFPNAASKAVYAVFGLPKFCASSIEVTRLGVRSKFCLTFAGSFADLVARFRRRYAAPTDDLGSIFGNSARLVDIGLPLNFEGEDGAFNTNSGPMNREQLKQFFAKKEGLPEVGLYFEVDYFQQGNTSMTADRINDLITSYADRSWEFQERIGRLVLRS